jgi:membrane protein implicated in regulation of membrane protease activity
MEEMEGAGLFLLIVFAFCGLLWAIWQAIQFLIAIWPIVLTIAIAAVVVWLSWPSYKRWRQKQKIIEETRRAREKIDLIYQDTARQMERNRRRYRQEPREPQHPWRPEWDE